MTHPQKTLVLRADAGFKMGIGHMMRCLALGQAWRDLGGRVVFLTALNFPALVAKIKKEGFEHVSLPVRPGGSQDAHRTVAEAVRRGAQWVVVDGYHFSQTFFENLEAGTFGLVRIDDQGSSLWLTADFVVNQNLYAQKSLYPHRSPKVRLLLGPRYVLLRKEFNLPFEPRRTRATPTRLLLSFGGTDPLNATKIVLMALRNQSSFRFHIDVVVGGGYKKEKALEKLVQKPRIHRISFHRDPANMASLMAKADLAVTSAGSTVWEMARLGLPALLIPQAENQRANAIAAHQAGVSRNLGFLNSLDENIIKREIIHLAASKTLRKQMSHNGRRLIDGNGAKRVVKCLMGYERGAPVLSLRKACASDCRRVWSWANDPASRSASFSSEKIPWKHHQLWFKKRLRDTQGAFFIALDSARNPMGVVRFETRNRELVLSLFIDESHRGQRQGVLLIRKGVQKCLRKFPGKEVHAYVKPSNTASSRAFFRAGFHSLGFKYFSGERAVHFIYGKRSRP